MAALITCCRPKNDIHELRSCLNLSFEGTEQVAMKVEEAFEKYKADIQLTFALVPKV